MHRRTSLAVLAVLALSLGFALADASSAIAAPPPVSPVPFNATTCDSNTCQVIFSSRTDVTNWYAQTTASSSVCTYAKFLVNGSLLGESGSVCLSKGQSTSSDWSNPGRFASGSQLCTTWVGVPGKACDTVS